MRYLRVNKRKIPQGSFTVQAEAAIDLIRHETFEDRDHLVVPIVALIESVIFPSNAPFPELALANEFGRHPDGWNGRPVVLGHPVRNGTPVSANTPEILEAEAFGMLFNTFMEDKKLKTEAWIDLERVANLSTEIQDAVAKLQSGDITEVSTGLFLSLESQEGKFKGKEFGGIWRDVVPDHLAILPEGEVGACSVADGAGIPRINKDQKLQICTCGATCNKCIENVKHSWTNIQVLNRKEPDKERKGLFESLMKKFGSIFDFRAQSLSDTDLRTALQSALVIVNNESIWILAVFPEENVVIFEKGFDGSLFKQSFSLSTDGNIELGDEVVAVRPVTEFVPLSSNLEDDQMDKTKMVAALIANEQSPFTADQKDFLMSLSENQLKVFTAQNAETLSTDNVDNTEPVIEKPVESEEPTDNASASSKKIESKSAILTAEQYIEQAPETMQEVLRQGLRLQQQRREHLITTITANTRNPFTTEDLKAMDVMQLENLAILAGSNVDYSLAGGASNPESESAITANQADPAPKVFESSQKSA